VRCYGINSIGITDYAISKGHKFSPGVNGQLRRDATLELISQLNEVIKSGDGTKRPKLHRLIRNLITKATTGDDKIGKNGEIIEGTGDLTAILAIIDRLWCVEPCAQEATRAATRR
jgi:hypothetical protein